MHLTGDSVIRQNGEGVVIEIIAETAQVVWDNEAFVAESPKNYYHPVDVGQLSAIGHLGYFTGEKSRRQMELDNAFHSIVSAPLDMRPTNRLRWADIPPPEQKGLSPNNAVYMHTLQQYWEDNQGNGEWRDVPTENEGK